ncbi:hypothetical protein [Nocardia sp. NBC_01009]|uniref:hypothetical protein n=1 Tax=Nocardia sp. NBC_01009 TaxID=2975996 RepID=UPI0038653769|nr:hypothetical protein OHA42_31835 [Nocardia sp. NBC_01009]
MTPFRATDTGAEHLTCWVSMVGQRLPCRSSGPAEQLLAHALSGFLAVGRASLALLTTARGPDCVRGHDLVYEITADAEMWLTDAAGERTVNVITDRGETLYEFLTPTDLDDHAATELRRAAHATALRIYGLLTAVGNDPAHDSGVRDVAHHMAAGADLIAKVYHDNEPERHLLSELEQWVGENLRLGPTRFQRV